MNTDRLNFDTLEIAHRAIPQMTEYEAFTVTIIAFLAVFIFFVFYKIYTEIKTGQIVRFTP